MKAVPSKPQPPKIKNKEKNYDPGGVEQWYIVCKCKCNHARYRRVFLEKPPGYIGIGWVLFRKIIFL
jgi:hypothetical protein